MVVSVGVGCWLLEEVGEKRGENSVLTIIQRDIPRI
jgi:hypothetical protein